MKKESRSIAGTLEQKEDARAEARKLADRIVEEIGDMAVARFEGYLTASERHILDIHDEDDKVVHKAIERAINRATVDITKTITENL